MGPGEPREIGQGGGSWRFFGTEVMARLGPRFEVRHFGKEDIEPGDAGVMGWADVVVVIKLHKCIPRLRTRKPVVFVPLDAFSSVEELHSSVAADAIRRAHTVIVNNENLASMFRHPRKVYLDHHYLDAYDGPRVFVREAPVLWVGVGDYAPPLVAWYQRRRPKWHLVCLTNGDGRRTILGADLGTNVFVTKWKAHENVRYAGECGYALDFKSQTFHHRTKPHTKAAFYLASGLPVAMSADHPSRAFLKTRFGIEPPEPADESTWFSEAYWAKIQAVRERARQELSVEAVGARLGDILAGVCQACA